MPKTDREGTIGLFFGICKLLLSKRSGFCFYSNQPTDNKTYLIENLIPISFNYYQDKESATGAAPKETSYSTYIQSTSNPDKTYTYT